MSIERSDYSKTSWFPKAKKRQRTSREQQVHGMVKAPKGTERVRNNTEAKGCILRFYSDMVAVNIISFKIYIKGVRVLQ